MHDTLITRWPRLRELVDGAKEPLRWKRRSFEGRYAERASLRGRPLEQAEEYVEEAPAVFADAERAYVHAQRRAARGRTAVWILAPVALVGVAGVIFAFTHRSDSAVTAAVKSAGNLETRANGIAADNPVHARALLLEAYRQRPHDLESRNALAEAVSLAPSLVATGSTTGGAAVLPDLSEVIEPNGVGCARVHTAQGVVSSRKSTAASAPRTSSWRRRARLWSPGSSAGAARSTSRPGALARNSRHGAHASAGLTTSSTSRGIDPWRRSPTMTSPPPTNGGRVRRHQTGSRCGASRAARKRRDCPARAGTPRDPSDCRVSQAKWIPRAPRASRLCRARMESDAASTPVWCWTQAPSRRVRAACAASTSRHVHPSSGDERLVRRSRLGPWRSAVKLLALGWSRISRGAWSHMCKGVSEGCMYAHAIAIGRGEVVGSCAEQRGQPAQMSVTVQASALASCAAMQVDVS